MNSYLSLQYHFLNLPIDFILFCCFFCLFLASIFLTLSTDGETIAVQPSESSQTITCMHLLSTFLYTRRCSSLYRDLPPSVSPSQILTLFSPLLFPFSHSSGTPPTPKTRTSWRCGASLQVSKTCATYSPVFALAR